MSIIAAADGSALGNPGPMGWAWFISQSQWAAGGSAHGTNNGGELTAVLELLRATAAAGRAGEDLEILCDSQYVINSLTTWLPGWKRKGWKKADGTPVMNVELMRELDAQLQGRNVRFSWVKGHAGHPLNEAADAKARAAATAMRDGLQPASGPGFGHKRQGESDFTLIPDDIDDADLLSGMDELAVRRERRAAQSTFEWDVAGFNLECARTTSVQDAELALWQVRGDEKSGNARDAVTAARGRRQGVLADDALLIDDYGRAMSPETWARQLHEFSRSLGSAGGVRALGPVTVTRVTDGVEVADYTVTFPRAVLRITSVWVAQPPGTTPSLAMQRWGETQVD